MIIFVEANDDIDKLIVTSLKQSGVNSNANAYSINRFLNTVVDTHKGVYSKEELLAAFNRMFKRNVALLTQTVSSREIQDSNPNNYEASPNIIKRLYSPRLKAAKWGGYQLNKYEKDIVSFIDTNSHSKMDAIRNKPAFKNLSSMLIKNAPVQKILYRKENTLRVTKVGDIVSFELRSFSANPHYLVMMNFTKGQGQEVIYRITGLQGINIGAYAHFTKVGFYEDEYLCTGKCKVTSIGKNGKIIVIDAKTV
jgi:hypothetical protein